MEDTERIRRDLNEQYEKQEDIFRRSFVQVVRNNCDEVKQTIKQINRELARHPFSGTTYEISITNRKDDGSMYNKILEYAEKTKGESDRFEPQGPLFEMGLSVPMDEEDKELVKDMNDIISRITTDDKAMEEYADYRNYMNYDVLITRDEQFAGKVSLSKQSRVGSGAELQISYLLMLLSALMITYTPNSSRLVIMDEPFTKMDPGKIREMLSFMKDQDFQCIFCVPDRKDGLMEMCDKQWMLTRSNNRVHVFSASELINENQPIMVSGTFPE